MERIGWVFFVAQLGLVHQTLRKETRGPTRLNSLTLDLFALSAGLFQSPKIVGGNDPI